jgi:REP element-mobilizing transposase RayT
MTTSNFNLSPPPAFRGLHPDLPVTIYHRHLPHWRQDGATYFVTFRLGDSLPQEKLRLLKRMRSEWERTHPPPRSERDWEEYAREYTTQVERWLDEGYGECLFRERRWADDLQERLHHFHGERYLLSCWAILPNHCHLVIRPHAPDSLEDLLGAMKGVTARHLNAALSRQGTVWEEECYDRIVRDEEHLWRIVQYIGRNPHAAGCGHENAWRRWIHPEWEAAGWRFIDE